MESSRLNRAAGKRVRAEGTDDIRPPLQLEAGHPQARAQLVKLLPRHLAFRRSRTRMFDPAGVQQTPLDLMQTIYRTSKPSRHLSENVISEAMRIVEKDNAVPEVRFVSTRPQWRPAGGVQQQPGCVASRVFVKSRDTLARPVGPDALERNLDAPAGDALIGVFACPASIADLCPALPLACPEETVEDQAALLAALVAPSLLAFPGHVAFFVWVETAAWLLPLLDLSVTPATLPPVARLAVLDQSMVPAVALQSSDPSAVKFARAVLATRDGPVYLVGDSARDGLPAIPCYRRAAPTAALLAQVPAMIARTLADADALPGPRPVTFLDALTRVFAAAGLVIATDTVVSMPSNAATAGPAKRPCPEPTTANLVAPTPCAAPAVHTNSAHA
jgi:hypothetical protein